MTMYPTTSWDETAPAGSSNISSGDDAIRTLKTQIREIVDVDHDFPSSGQAADNGQHKKVTLQEQANLGTGAVNATLLGSQTASGKGELVYTDEDDNDIQITSGGKLCCLGSGVPWRAGDLLISSSTSTPSGWTDVSTTYDNKFIRIGDDTPLTTTGGADTHDHGGTSGSHTLTAAEIPAHTHTINVYNRDGSGAYASESNGSSSTGTYTTSSIGGGGGHDHTITSASSLPAYIQTRMYKKS